MRRPALSEPVASALSTAVREGSRAEHEAAEGSAFVTELLAGRVCEEGYAAYLRRLRPVYAALETVGREHRSDPWVAAVHDPVLERLAALDADLAHWSPRGPVEERTPAVTSYVGRLAASASWGGLFVAHHYTRYLGDLSGGQAIGRILERTFDLGDLGGVGTAFYDFPAISRVKPYKDAYRVRLDALDAGAEDVAAVVAEVRVAFELNRALLEELGEELPRWRREQ